MEVVNVIGSLLEGWRLALCQSIYALFNYFLTNGVILLTLNESNTT